MKKALILILSASLLLLPSCGSRKAKSSTTSKSGIYESASGISSDTVLLTVDSQDVTAGQYLYWLADTCGYITKYYDGKSVNWKEEHGGRTLAEYAKEQALSTVSLYGVIESWADKYGCTLTDSDQAGIDKQWKARVKQYGSEKAYKKALTAMGIDQKTVRRFSADYYLYSHLYHLFCTKGSSLYPKQSDVERYAKKQGMLTVDTILISTAKATDDTAKAEKKERAEMVLAKLKKSKTPTEYFSTLTGAYSDDDNSEKHPDGLTFSPGDGTFPTTVDTAAKSLKENTYSGIVETDKGFYILLRLPLDKDAVNADYFDYLLQNAANNASIHRTAAYKKINPETFCKKLAAAQKKNTQSTGNSSSAG